MKKIIILAVVLLTAVGGFCEDEKPVRDAAEKLLNLMNMDKTFDKTMKQAMKMPVNMIESQDLPAEEKEKALQSVNASMKVTLKKFSWKKMKTMFVDIYAEVLSLEELEGLIKFYESPIGQQYIKKQPELTAATMKKMQVLMQDLMPEIQKEVEKSLKESKNPKESDLLLEGEE